MLDLDVYIGHVLEPMPHGLGHHVMKKGHHLFFLTIISCPSNLCKTLRRRAHTWLQLSIRIAKDGQKISVLPWWRRWKWVTYISGKMGTWWPQCGKIRGQWQLSLQTPSLKWEHKIEEPQEGKNITFPSQSSSTTTAWTSWLSPDSSVAVPSSCSMAWLRVLRYSLRLLTMSQNLTEIFRSGERRPRTTLW